MSSERSLDEAILEQVAEAVVFADRGGVIRRWNAAATAMFGFTAAEAIGRRRGAGIGGGGARRHGARRARQGGEDGRHGLALTGSL
jgi:PAS domain S-box-containing protein